MDCADIPYLEDLIKYLKGNQVIQDCFPEIGSVKLAIGPQIIEEMLKDNCPYKSCIIIYPGSYQRTNRDKNCGTNLVQQVLSIALVRKCNGKHFEFEKVDDDTVLGGDYMDLACMRKKLMDELKCFDSMNVVDFYWNRTFETTSKDCLLITGVEYGVTYAV